VNQTLDMEANRATTLKSNKPPGRKIPHSIQDLERQNVGQIRQLT
jgi:hypothetical protein